MWVRNWYGSYDGWRLLKENVKSWGAHRIPDYERDLNELLQATMLEF